jgi:phosphatidate cytidylyltransferase
MNDSLSRRTAAGSAFVLIVIGLAYVGGIVFLFFVLAVIGLALREFFSLVRAGRYAPFAILGTSLGLALAVCTFVFGPRGLAWSLAVALLACAAAPLLRRSKREFSDGAVTALGIFYVGFLGSHMVLLRGCSGTSDPPYDRGFAVLMAAFAATWCSDSGAYLVGSAVGKHKLIPAVSPGKSWEGAGAGLLGAVGGLALAHRVLGGPLAWPEIFPLGLVLGVIALIGDLVESALKRSVGWKDTAGIIPGHGGILDRFDSFLFVAPAVYYYLVAAGYVTAF